MDCHWRDKSMSFDRQGELVQLQGVRPAPQSMLSALDIRELQYLEEANDIWVVTLIVPVNQTEDDTSSKQPRAVVEHYPIVEAVLEDFEDVFTEPTTLPP